MLARSFKGVEVRRQSESISNAGPLADITGSVSATIDSLTDQAAIISYKVHAKGLKSSLEGGTLHGGGTILFTSDGRVVRIPPGDPFERQARAAFSAVSAFVKRIEGGEPLRRLRGEPEFASGALGLSDGRAILFTQRESIEIPRDQLDRKVNVEFGQLASLADKVRSAGPPQP